MSRLALLSCALLVACGGSKQQQQQQTYDLAGLDLVSTPHDFAHQGDMPEGDMPPPGPSIQVVSPTAATANVEVMLDIIVTDVGSTVQPQNVVCSILKNNDTALTTKTTSPLELTADIVFNNYNPVLANTVDVTIDVTDDAGKKASKTIIFSVDASGPVITIDAPLQGTMIGGPTHVKATITDMPSGVDPTSVFATFTANSDFEIPLTNTTMDTYEGDFDAARLGKSFIFPTITVRANDTIGNSSNVSYQLKADNVAPTLSLDSPPMRVWQLNAMNQRECSASFDPLGSDALNDGYNSASYAQLLTIRARAEDEGNMASGQTVTYFAGIDSSTMKLVAITAPPGNDANGLPAILAVDEDGDGVCDTLNPTLSAVMPGMMAMTMDQYLALSLAQSPGGGTPDFRADTIDPIPANCDVVGDATVTMAPMPLCQVAPTDLTYVLNYSAAGIPTLWSLPPIAANPTECTGEQFDTLNLLPEGWACFAAMASDTVHNLGISAPLRACIRRTSMANHPCDVNTTPPDCTGTYNPMTKVVSATPCTPNVFVSDVRQKLP